MCYNIFQKITIINALVLPAIVPGSIREPGIAIDCQMKFDKHALLVFAEGRTLLVVMVLKMVSQRLYAMKRFSVIVENLFLR